VRTVRTLRVPWYRKLTAGPSWHKLYLDVLLTATALGLARRFRPDVLHAHLHEGVFLGRLVSRLAGGIPLLGDFQGSMTTEMADHGFFSGWPWGERFFLRLEGAINRAPGEIVVSSRQAMRQILPARGDRPHTVSLLDDGVDAAAFRPDAAARARVRADLGVGERDLVVGYLGLLTEYQGVDLLLEAAALVVRRMPSARFLVMGFPNVERYQEAARRLGLGARMRFTGRVRYEEAPAHLAAVDVAVSPKLSLTEANGKLLDYMSVGLPTVVFDTAINREILGDLGVFARYGDPEHLAGCLVEVLGNAPLRAERAEELRRRAVAEFSWEARARRFEEIYARLIGRPAHARAAAA
jgi:glycosyltransferase involved in cell wall biosynthesis